MRKVSIFEAKTHFSSLIEAVISGETVLVTKRGVPVARITPIEREKKRVFGIARQLFASGAIRVEDNFDAPLPARWLRKLQDK